MRLKGVILKGNGLVHSQWRIGNQYSQWEMSNNKGDLVLIVLSSRLDARDMF